MMKNRVLGLIIVAANKSLWNGDFEGNPNRCLNEYVGSPYSLKYSYRNYWYKRGLKVLFFKRLKEGIVKKIPTVMPKSLDEILEDIIKDEIGEDKLKIVDKKKKFTESQRILQNLVFEYIDVACFGGAFATTLFNNSYVGPIQFGYGVNKYDKAETIRTTMLSPFQNSSNSEAESSTLGSNTYLSEGHYVYDFTINPNVNKMYHDLFDDFKGFTREDYENFKEASLRCVNENNSVSKKGCYNEFAMFVELKEGSNKYFGSINEKVKYRKDEKTNKGVIDLSLIEKDLKEIYDDIETIEIYHNPVDTEVILSLTDKVSIKNILSENEVDFTTL